MRVPHEELGLGWTRRIRYTMTLNLEMRDE